jgi:Tol biopolymer transport system component
MSEPKTQEGEMKKSLLITAVFLLLSSGFGSLVPQNGHDQFQKALAKERGEGNLEEAIALYQKVVEETKDESLAAQAQYRIGACYEKLGKEKAKLAQDAFQKVVDKYPAQADTVKMAREKLVVLAKAQAPPPPTGGNLTVRKIISLGHDGSPSPDGSFISFTDWGQGDLAAKDLATGSVRRLTKNATGDQFVGHSVVSPDNRKIAYSWYDENGVYSLWLINVDGTGNRPLYRGRDDWHTEPLDWSPDGRQILAVHTLSYPSQACKIVLVAASDGSMNVLKELGRKAPSNMCFSPDGRFIVYDYPSGQSTTSDIFVLPVDGGKEAPLIENPANDQVLGWTPDGRYILFASDRAGSRGAWLVAVQDGQAQGTPRLVKQDLGSIEPMGFARDGTFYYGIGGWVHDLYAQDVDLEGGKLLEAPELAVQSFIGSNGMPAWSPDGENLAYLSRRTPAASSAQSFTLCIRSTQSGQERVLFPDLDWFQWPRWSPDGKALIVAGSDRSNHLGAYMIDALTGAVSPVLNTEKDDYNAVNLLEWSHDGRSVYFTRNDWTGQKSEIILRSLETGKENRITALAEQNRFFTLPLLSPDGRSLAVLVLDQDQKSNILAVMPAEGGKPRELLELKGNENIPGLRGLAWGPDSRTILFVKFIKAGGQESPNRGRNELWLLATETGEQRKLGDLLKGPGVEISLHPNGRNLVFSTGVYKSEVWVMENFLPADNTQGKDKR